ncbi:MAG TPA: hypothetical protein VJQ25_08800 [Nitrospira sp.]|nr:hypothetical protein [Nitrospira sp.]
MTEIDLLSDSPDNAAVPDSPALATISKLAEEYDLLQKDLKILAERTRVREERVKEIQQQAMPLAMEQAGVTSFVAKNGRSIKIKEIISGSIPAISSIQKAKGEDRVKLETRRITAFEVVRKLWPGLLKTELSVSFGRGEAELALRAAKLLREQLELNPAIDESVHHASLNSHFKELKDTGRLGEIPPEPFNLYIGPIAEIK